MVSKNELKMGARKTPIQRTYKMTIGSDSINEHLLGSNRQFDWLEITKVYD